MAPPSVQCRCGSCHCHSHLNCSGGHAAPAASRLNPCCGNGGPSAAAGLAQGEPPAADHCCRAKGAPSPMLLPRTPVPSARATSNCSCIRWFSARSLDSSCCRAAEGLSAPVRSTSIASAPGDCPALPGVPGSCCCCCCSCWCAGRRCGDAGGDTSMGLPELPGDGGRLCGSMAAPSTATGGSGWLQRMS